MRPTMSAWQSRSLREMSIPELQTALNWLRQEFPGDRALELALRRELARATAEEWMFEDLALPG